MTPVASIPTGKRTMYELVAECDDGRRILVQYTNRKGFKDLYHALQDQFEYIEQVFGTTDFTRLNTPDFRLSFGNWIVRFSGRTQRDAIRTELPFIRDIA